MKNILLTIKNNFIENKKRVLIVLTIWVFIVTCTLFLYSGTLGVNSDGNSFYDEVVELTNDTTIKQRVILTRNNINSIGIRFATYRRTNKGSVNVKIVGENSNNIYLDKTFDVRNVLDNEFRVFDLDTGINLNNDNYILITINSDCEPGSAIGLAYNSSECWQNSSLTINNNEVFGTISFRYLFPSDLYSKFSSIVLFWSIAALTFIIIWLLIYKPNYEWFFGVLALCLGLIFMCIMSPSSPPDEVIHYELSLQESNRLMLKNDVYDMDYDYFAKIARPYYADTVNNKLAYQDIMEHINDEYQFHKKMKSFDVDINQYYKLAFVPQAIGVTIARLMNLNPLKVFYSGRLTNLLFYVICVYICLKNTPIHKPLIGIIACLPIALQQAASHSYDCFLNGLSLVTIGYILKFVFSKEKIKTKDIIVAFIVAILISPLKYIYSLFTLLYMFTPNEKFESKYKKWLFVLFINIPMLYQLVPILLPRIMRLLGSFKIIKAEETVLGKKEYYSMGYITSHLSETIILIVRTIRYQIKTWFYGSLGRYLSQLTLVLPLKFMWAIIAIILCALSIKQEYVFEFKFFIVSIAVCLTIGVLSILGMLLGATTIGSEYVSGIQGRYYYPLLPYFFVSLSNNKLNISRKVEKYVIFSYILVFFEIIIYILSYTFVN